jgi:hypothetical protein
MLGKIARFALLLGMAVAITLLAARHAQPASLSGRWRDQSPAALLYEFRNDGSVWLIRDGRDVPVFRYEVEGDVVVFHDGMGRPRSYRFTLDGDMMVLREIDTADGAVSEYKREP